MLFLNKVVKIFCVIFIPLAVPASEKFGISSDKQNWIYQQDSIPAELVKDANVLVRNAESCFYVEGPDEATLRTRKIITILNQQGRSEGEITLTHDAFNQLKKFKGRLLDKNGREVRKLSRDELRDYAATSSFSLYDDNRVFVTELFYNEFPYTIEYSYEIEFDGLINWPSWYPIEEKQAVQFNKFELNVPEEMDFRYRCMNIEINPVDNSTDHRKIFVWQVSNLPCPDFEEYGPRKKDQLPVVIAAPIDFEISDSKGSMKEWNSFGKWFYQLYANCNVLPEQAKKQIEEIRANSNNETELIGKLYEYMQNMTRYVSVQLGIGGWKPYDARYVSEKGYGDCKALTNFMKSVLDYVSIPSFPALINSGIRQHDLMVDFPCNQFNHVILCVPQPIDTIWLECTSQTIPLGHIGAENENRYVLVVKPEGGELKRTPRSYHSDNQRVRKAEILMDELGSASVKVREIYTGNQQDYIRRTFQTRTGAEREKWLYENIECPGFKINKTDFSVLLNRSMQMEIGYELESQHFATVSGKRLMIRPHLIDKFSTIPPDDKHRVHPIVFKYPYQDMDTLLFTIPTSFKAETIPNRIDIANLFGKYSIQFNLSEPGTLILIRNVEINSSLYPPEEYDAFQDFFRQIVRGDQLTAVFLKN